MSKLFVYGFFKFVESKYFHIPHQFHNGGSNFANLKILTFGNLARHHFLNIVKVNLQLCFVFQIILFARYKLKANKKIF